MAKRQELKVILAVAYCRKSTNEEMTEKSIADQQARIAKLQPQESGTRYEIVRWYTADKGVPGWKRGAKRPDYFRLIKELKENGAKAILVDDMDRFSRADEFEVVSHTQELREVHRIRYIHSVNQGSVDLVADQYAPMKIAMGAMAGHEFCTRLSRRLAHARLDAAMKGLRSGGRAPYGMAMANGDGKPVTPGAHTRSADRGKRLIPGDPKEVKVVQWIFDQFVTHGRSMNWLAADLNRRGVPRRTGKKWYVASLRELLQRREYVGDFSYNSRRSGEFHVVQKVGSQFEVVRTSNYHDDKPSPWKLTSDDRIVRENTHKGIISRKLFNAAQKRLAEFKLKGSRKPRAGGYPLSRILICDHCGKPMYGCHPTGRKHRVYRCGTPAKSGIGTCGTFEVREEVILPFVMRLLGEEITDLRKLLSSPPDELREPNKVKADQRKQLEQDRQALSVRIEKSVERLLDIEDRDTRQALDRKISEMRTELREADAALAVKPTANGYSRRDLEALNAWWEDFEKHAVSVPVPGDPSPECVFWQDPNSEEQAFMMDARRVNEALHALGCEVRLRWKTEQVTLPSGKVRTRHRLVKGRFRLGQKKGDFTGKNGVIKCNVPLGAACNGIAGGGRCGSRRGRDSGLR